MFSAFSRVSALKEICAARLLFEVAPCNDIPVVINEEEMDLLIIGAGPAGLSAAESAAREGLRYRVIEKRLIADTIYRYPVGRTVFSTPNELEMYKDTLRPCREKPTREELLSHYIQFALSHKLNINTEEETKEIVCRGPNHFIVRTTRSEYQASRVLVAFGAMALRRRLNVPGEDLPKVHHRFIETYPYVLKDVLVVGGGNSAGEATLSLAEDGVRTTLAIWRSDWENFDPKLGAIKHWVRIPLEREIEAGRLRLILFTEIEEIRESEVSIRTEDGKSLLLPNDAVFVLIGSDADLTMLRSVGVETVRAGLTDVPVHDPETFETKVPGLYVVGHFTLSRHIKNAIQIPRKIVPHIARTLRSSTRSSG